MVGNSRPNLGQIRRPGRSRICSFDISVVNTALLNAELGITANHATRYMDQLRDGGAVTIFKVHQRGLYWKADAVLDALDSFAARRRFPTVLG